MSSSSTDLHVSTFLINYTDLNNVGFDKRRDKGLTKIVCKHCKGKGHTKVSNEEKDSNNALLHIVILIN